VVAIDGDTIVVGDSGYSAGRGRAYVFERSGETWIRTDQLLGPSPEAGDDFGGVVAISGGHAILGAQGDNSGRGAAYIYTPEPATLSLLALGGLAMLRRKAAERSLGTPRQ